MGDTILGNESTSTIVTHSLLYRPTETGEQIDQEAELETTTVTVVFQRNKPKRHTMRRVVGIVLRFSMLICHGLAFSVSLGFS
jgi:hypothetical protein